MTGAETSDSTTQRNGEWPINNVKVLRSFVSEVMPEAPSDARARVGFPGRAAQPAGKSQRWNKGSNRRWG